MCLFTIAIFHKVGQVYWEFIFRSLFLIISWMLAVIIIFWMSIFIVLRECTLFILFFVVVDISGMLAKLCLWGCIQQHIFLFKKSLPNRQLHSLSVFRRTSKFQVFCCCCCCCNIYSVHIQEIVKIHTMYMNFMRP